MPAEATSQPGAARTSALSARQPTEYPRLRHCTLLDPADGGPLTVIVGRDRFSLTEEMGTREVFLRVKSHFDGRYSVAEISQRTGVAEGSVRAIVDTFHELGLLREEEPLDTIPVAAFVARLDEACAMWSRQIGYHELFQLLHRGDVRREVFQGWVLETYHYVKSAQKHVAVALAHCTDYRWQDLLADYFNEEYDHAPLLLDTLENLGILRERAETAHPLIGTMSLINALCDVGRSSTLSYLACTALFEARAEDALPARRDFLEIADRYGYSEDDVAPLLAHLLGDVDAGHAGLLDQALKGRESVTAAEAHMAVNALHDVKHSFDQYHDQILHYYSDISNYIPRLKVDYFSL